MTSDTVYYKYSYQNNGYASQESSHTFFPFKLELKIDELVAIQYPEQYQVGYHAYHVQMFPDK